MRSRSRSKAEGKRTASWGSVVVTKHSVHTWDMTERTESYGTGLAELMSPELARNPQPMYSMLLESSPILRVDGVGVIVLSRTGVQEVLRNPDVFSSNMSAHDLKTKRPLIPLQIDPPDHRKYRKFLDPMFAPQRMRALDEPASRLVNDLIDGFIDDEEIDFAKQFSTPVPVAGVPHAVRPAHGGACRASSR